MYYRCPTCNLVWYYPLHECVYCHHNVEHILPQHFKIVGITNVNIASVQNPKVPYAVLLLEDEHGQTHTRKTFKTYEIGQTLDWPSGKLDLKTGVALQKIGYDFEATLQTLLTLFPTRTFDPAQKILLKVTLTPTESCPLLTSPELARLMIAWLHTNGAGQDQITLVDRLPRDADVDSILTTSGFAELAQTYAWINLTTEAHESIPDQNVLFDIPQTVLHANFMVHLPILKIPTHKAMAPITESLATLLPGQLGHNLEKMLNYRTSSNLLPDILHVVDAAQAVVNPSSDSFKTVSPKLLLASYSNKPLDRAIADMARKPYHDRLTNTDTNLLGEELAVLQSEWSLFT